MSKISRRNFLAKAAGAAAAGIVLPTIIPASALGKNGTVAPSNRINCGIIGNGMQSGGHRHNLSSRKETQMLAVCDVKEDVLKRVQEEVNRITGGRNDMSGYKGCDAYIDYQELIDRPDIDAVCIVTPDHWHVAQALYAVNRGKAVYCEKPLTLTIEEGRILSDAVKRNGAILQVGSQQRSEWQFRKAAELVRNGKIGKVKEIYTGIGDFRFPAILPEQPIPSTLHYDKWLGQTPWFPYNEQRIKGDYGGGWRNYWEYGSRKEGDWGAHHYDIIQWALGMDNSGPTTFYPYNENNGCRCRSYSYDKGPTVYVNPPDGLTKGYMIRFVGEEGEIRVSRGGKIETMPFTLSNSVLEAGSLALHASQNHMTDWVNSIKTGRQPICTAEIGHRTATICHLNAISMRLNRIVKWDPAKEMIIGDEQAKSMQSRPRRAPYFLGA